MTAAAAAATLASMTLLPPLWLRIWTHALSKGATVAVGVTPLLLVRVRMRWQHRTPLLLLRRVLRLPALPRLCVHAIWAFVIGRVIRVVIAPLTCCSDGVGRRRIAMCSDT